MSAQTPFEDGRFSFDPKKVTAYSPLLKKKRRPGDLFGSFDIQRSQTLVGYSRILSAYRAIRYSKRFRNKAFLVFLFFFLPGLIAASLLIFGIL